MRPKFRFNTELGISWKLSSKSTFYLAQSPKFAPNWQLSAQNYLILPLSQKAKQQNGVKRQAWFKYQKYFMPLLLFSVSIHLKPVQ